MKEIVKNRRMLALCLASPVVLLGWLAGADLGAEDCPFSTSLHHTGEGMRYWYEEQGGFM